jgi:glycosyltransferase involved in cell wall biosynthesis
MFPGHDVYFLHVTRDDWAPLTLFHERRVADVTVDLDGLLTFDFHFVVFVGFKDRDFTRRLASQRPSFCYTDTFPHPDVPRDAFRGILSHRSGVRDGDILLVGGSFDETVFYRDRKDEAHVLAVGRIHPDKNQLELVSAYRETIFERYGLPLYLAGGVEDLDYYREVQPFIDGVSVLSSIVDPSQPFADANWRSGPQIAELCNRARLFVSASRKESFSLAMIEAIACGTTCVVNGDYWGFAESDLRPNVHGNITAKRGSVIDLAAQALRDDVRIDGSEWARTYSLREMRDSVVRFIDERV